MRLRCDDGSSRRERQRNVGREFHSFVIGRNAKLDKDWSEASQRLLRVAVGRVFALAFNGCNAVIAGQCCSESSKVLKV